MSHVPHAESPPVDKIPHLLQKFNGYKCIRVEIFMRFKFAFDSAFANIKRSWKFHVLQYAN
jgi:hypothetical protein